MKNLVVIAAILGSYSAIACQQESQFIAQIGSSKMVDGTCILSVKSFSHYNVSNVCPLFESDVYQEGISTAFGEQTCANMEGAEISGYLVRASDTAPITLD